MAASINFTKRNIRRSPFQAIAACMTMFMTFFALGAFMVLGWNSQIILKYYENKPQVIAFFKDGTTANDITAIENALARDTRVSKVKYVSSQDALNIYRGQNKKDPTLLELVTANMLPASLEISTVNPEDLQTIAQIVKKEPVVSDIVLPEDVIKNLTTFTNSVRIVGACVVAYLVLFSLLIILMIIGFKIRLKKDEIEIMRLIGASNSFIRTPFILEGIFYGLVGAVTSWVIIYLILWYFTPLVQNFVGEINLLPISPMFMLTLLGVEVVGAIIIGALGSISAVRRYLHI